MVAEAVSYSDRIWTEDEYLALEEQSALKHELIDGHIYAMAGAKPDHNRVAAAALASLYAQLRGKPCEPFGSDQRVRTPSGSNSYPDVVVACPPLQCDRTGMALLDATVILEVLSPSTASLDRADKFRHGSTLPSLRHYVLIEQNAVLVEHRFRGDDGEWRIEVLSSRQDVLHLPGIECELPLGELYERLDFEAEVEIDGAVVARPYAPTTPVDEVAQESV